MIRGLAVAAWVAIGCAPAPSPSTPPVSQRTFSGAPNELLPSDLDVVVRIDAERLRRTYGDEDFTKTLGGDAAGDTGLPAAVRAVLPRAATVWIGLRGIHGEERHDGIVAATGDFSDLDFASVGRGFARAGSSPTDVVFVRAPERRASFARAVVVGHRGIAFATSVEADALDRVLRDGADPGRLDPPADGVVGFAARVRSSGVLSRDYPHLARVLDDLGGARGSFDAVGGVLRFEATLSFKSEDGATHASTVLETLRTELVVHGHGAARALAESASFDRAGDTEIVARIRARGDVLRPILAGSTPVPP